MNSKTFFKELEGESDRACALIAGAAVSDGLCDLLKQYCVKLEESDIDRLFYDRGALGDFASRTEVSFALGLISPTKRLMANIIRNIRNQYAHTLAQIDFSNELIVSELSKISMNNSLGSAEPKAVFIGISMKLYVALLARCNYLLRRRSGLGGAQVPIYELSKGGRGMVAPSALSALSAEHNE